MMNYTIKISDFLSDLADIFSGSYTHNDSEINEIRNQIFDISHTPSADDDKEALKEDLNSFLEDAQLAHKSIKEELYYGETK